MSYRVKECFVTLQGEGARSGRVCVLCRMSGCNLWSGGEADRSKAICQFCDTNFVGTDGEGGGEFGNATDLVEHIGKIWGSDATRAKAQPYVVFTGGEPLLQLDGAAIDQCHERGMRVAVETNGTVHCPPGLDWICVSPKAGARLVVSRGDEMKLVWPQKGIQPSQFEQLAFDHWYLQPCDGKDQKANIKACVAYCMSHPRWRLSMQMHKAAGIR